jgi:predicted PurR-regulated permease PerM
MFGRNAVTKSRLFAYDFAERKPYDASVQSSSMDAASHQRASRIPWTMNVRPSPGWLYGALITVLSVWILHSFLQAVLAACVTAIASWPLYKRFALRVARHAGRSATSLMFTLTMTVLVLAPLTFAIGALVTEAQGLLMEIAAADRKGIGVPQWLENAPLVGHWAAARWRSEIAYPGALTVWMQRADTTALLGWAESLGQFMARHAFIIGFTILLLFSLYQEGESLAARFRRLLRHHVGERADGYLDLVTGAVRASVNSMLVVSLFDGFASGVVYALTGVPHAAVWAAITGLLALVPFLGYVAVVALTLQLAMTAGATPPLLPFGLGCLVLFCGDKIVRPAISRGGVRLRFAWVLMGCLGGFEALGLIGLVIGPVVLTLARELWEQRVRDLAPVHDT